MLVAGLSARPLLSVRRIARRNKVKSKVVTEH